MRPGDHVGPYRVLRLVAEGGMGLVYEAEQERPLRRRVALKILKPGMDTRQVVARFESERQALALMSHPYIAQVFDAGETGDGRPYVAMEFVPGLPIDEFCAREDLSVEARLALFADVCDAVQHAHQKGVIHRDLKPSNVLVTYDGDRAIPKVIDFGIAKALAQPLTRKTLYTEIGRFIGTPAYMSPEQADADGLDVDTRADVYSLGVLMYVLLAGVVPLEFADGTSVDEIRRRILDENPLRPSARAAMPLARRLRGDLDWIVLRALEKQRTRRYASASEFAADVRRHLAHEPVLAAAPSRVYRLRKFARRHRVGVVATATAALLLTVGVAGSGVGLVRATRARESARAQAETARQVAGFMLKLFDAGPRRGRAHDVTARELLDVGAARIGRELAAQPLMRTRLMETMGDVYGALGLWPDGRRMTSGAYRIRLALAGPADPDTGRLAAKAAGGFPLEERSALLERNLVTLTSALGADHPSTALTRYTLANTMTIRGDYDRAERLSRECVASGERSRPPDLKLQSWCWNEMGNARMLRGDAAGAVESHRRGLELKRALLGPRHPDVAMSLNNLADAERAVGRLADARDHLELALSIYRERLRPDHLLTLLPLANLGQTRWELGDSVRGRAMLEQALAGFLAVGEDGWAADVDQILGTLLLRDGRTAEAERHFAAALERRVRLFGPGHPLVRQSCDEDLRVLRRLGRANDAAKLERGSCAAAPKGATPGR